MGDAAHLSSLGGEGLNSAFMDGNIAWKLALVLRGSETIAARQLHNRRGLADHHVLGVG
jgi:2-polyprenyl-6-methoxyphenol hydroxylase-like FAD-dependent oxidoreductase